MSSLTLGMLDKKISRRHFFLFFSENRVWHFIHSVSLDNMHETASPVSRKKNGKRVMGLPSAEFAQSVLSIKIEI